MIRDEIEKIIISNINTDYTTNTKVDKAISSILQMFKEFISEYADKHPYNVGDYDDGYNDAIYDLLFDLAERKI